MTHDVTAFIDSDVIISSLISQTGAAYLLLNQPVGTFSISDLSSEEINKAIRRLSLSARLLKNLLGKRLRLVHLKEDVDKIKQKYAGFVFDHNDAHVVAGAVEAKANFLLTYNQKHYRIDKIKDELDIVVYTPAQFLQYIRSLE